MTGGITSIVRVIDAILCGLTHTFIMVLFYLYYWYIPWEQSTLLVCRKSRCECAVGALLSMCGVRLSPRETQYS